MGNSVVWENSLSRFKVYGSQTPKAFTDKRQQVPNDEASSVAAVFVDVLRATSTLLAVGAAGCAGIYVSVKPQAAALFPFVAPGGAPRDREWVFGGELHGEPIEGEDDLGVRSTGVIANSPLEASAAVLGGKYLRFFSTNGSEILQSVIGGQIPSVYAMALANVESTVDALVREEPARVWFTCGGFYGSQVLEDSVVAGLAIDRLLERGFATEQELDDEALSMLMLARLFKVSGAFDPEVLLARIKVSNVGRLLSEIGRQDDLRAAITLEGFDNSLLENMRQLVLKVDSSIGPFVVPATVAGAGA